MVCAETQQLDRVCIFVNPYQQEVVLDVALHASLVDAVKLMRFVSFGMRPACSRWRNTMARACIFSFWC